MRAKSWQHRLEPHVRRTIGTYEGAAGVFGALAILDRAPSHIARLPEAVHKQAAVLFTLMALVFVVVAVAGVLLFRGKRGGWPLTTVLQVAQIPLWSNAGSGYIFFAGLLGGVAWNPDGVRQFIGFEANMQLSWSTVPGRAVYFGINVVPLLVLCAGWLTRHVPLESLEALSPVEDAPRKAEGGVGVDVHQVVGVVSVASRAHRTLRKLPRFTAADQLVADASVRRLPGDLHDVIGIYENEPGQRKDMLVITETAVVLVDGEATREVPYAEMAGISLPDASEKNTLDHLDVVLRSGESVALPVRGGAGRLRDAWEVFRFLQRVLSDLGTARRTRRPAHPDATPGGTSE